MILNKELIKNNGSKALRSFRLLQYDEARQMISPVVFL